MIHFYCGSGSPYAWRVWLALEHKALPYQLHVLSFAAGDLKTDAFRAINPRGKVPAITDGDLALAESAAIVEYLDDAYPRAGERLLPASPQGRGVARWRIREIDEYVARALEDMVDQVLFTAEERRDAAAVTAARDRFLAELDRFETMTGEPFLLGAPGAVDFTLYPIVALALRMQERKLPALAVRERLGPRLSAWMRHVEALPYFARTYPPHWKAAA